MCLSLFLEWGFLYLMTLRPWPVRRALGWLYMVLGVLGLIHPLIWETWLTVKVYTSVQSLINWYTSRAHGYGRPGKLRELLYVRLNCLCAIHYSITLDHVVMDYTTLLLYLRSSTWTHSCYSPHTSGEVLGLWSTSQLDPVEWSLHPEIRVVYPLIVPKVISFILCTLCY